MQGKRAFTDLKQDERDRKILFPTRIVRTAGTVENIEQLLTPIAMQVGVGDGDRSALINGDDGMEAEVILDFGKEIHGCVRLITTWLKRNGELDVHVPGQVRITCGESVSETLYDPGEKNATNDHAPRDFMQDLPFLSDVTTNETAFRFVRIRLCGKNVRLPLKAVAAVVVYRDIPYLGSFRCDNETLNQIYDTAAYTCHLCMQNYIWDGVKRDRIVWVGDMYPEMLTVRTVFGDQKVLTDSLRYVREDTALPGWMNGMPSYSAWWILMIRDWYQYTGSRAFLEENREYVTGLLGQITDHINEDGTDRLPSYFLDWPSHDRPEEKDGARALFVWALEKGAELAKLYGDEVLAEKCLHKRECMQKTVFSTYGAKQAAAMLAFAECCDPEAAAKEILAGGASGWSTFMSFYLLKTAGKYDMAKTLHVLEEYYGGMLALGATTFWEDFHIEWMENAAGIDGIVPDSKKDIHADYGAFCYQGLRHSLCHGWSSGPTAFLAEEVLGISILEPGCKKIGISPKLGDLRFAEGTYPTPYGILSVSCKREADGSVSISYDAPDGIEIIL